MGNHFKLTAFLHTAQSLTQLSSKLSQAYFHLNQKSSSADKQRCHVPRTCGVGGGLNREPKR